MTRIEKIRQMTDEELAEFLSKIAAENDSAELLVSPDTLRRMPDAEVANLLERLDRADWLNTCTDNCPHRLFSRYQEPVRRVCADLAPGGGPLMDGEGA